MPAHHVVRCRSRRALPVTSCAADHVVHCPSRRVLRSRHALLTRRCTHVTSCGAQRRATAIRQRRAASSSRFPVAVPRRLQHRGRARLPAVPIEPSRRPALAAVAPHRVRIRSEQTSTDTPSEIERIRLEQDSNGYNVDAFRSPSSLEFDDS
jgi:hypothetical protein